mgnify:FL=1
MEKVIIRNDCGRALCVVRYTSARSPSLGEQSANAERSAVGSAALQRSLGGRPGKGKERKETRRGEATLNANTTQQPHLLRDRRALRAHQNGWVKGDHAGAANGAQGTTHPRPIGTLQPHMNHLRTNRVCRAEDGANPGPHLRLWGPAVCPNTPYRLNGSQWSSSTPCGAQNPLSRYHLQGWKEGSLPLFYGAERIQRRPQRPMAAKTPTGGLSHPIKKEESPVKDIK